MPLIINIICVWFTKVKKNKTKNAAWGIRTQEVGFGGRAPK